MKRASSSMYLPFGGCSHINNGRNFVNVVSSSSFEPGISSSRVARRRLATMDRGYTRTNRFQVPLYAGGRRSMRETSVILSGDSALPFPVGKREHGSGHHHEGGEFKWVERLIRKLRGEKDEEEEEEEEGTARGTKQALERQKKFHNYKLEAKEAKQQEKNIKFVTYLGLGINVALGGSKYVIGLLSNSQAMIADAVHSFTDVISDVVTLWALHMSSLPHDAQYPYGRGKFETVGTFLVAVTLVGTGVGIGGHSFDAFLNVHEIPTHLAVWGAVGSILLKELLYQATVRIGKKANSNLVIANAWHHRSDAISSIVALLGIGGALLGFPYLDPLAGMAVAAMIIKMGVTMGWESIKELTDASLDKEMLAYMGSLINKVDGIVEYRNIRARKMGTYQIVDVEIQVDPLLSVSVAHQLAQRVRLTLLDAIPQINEVLVHVDPEPPIEDTPETLMRPQSEITSDVAAKVSMLTDEVAGMSFLCCHYYNHRLTVEVDIVLKDNKKTIEEAQRIARKVQKEIMKISDIDYADVMMNLSLLERGGLAVPESQRKKESSTSPSSSSASTTSADETTNLAWLKEDTTAAGQKQQQLALPLPHRREFPKGRRPRLIKTK